jgi:hypothetical protein
MDFLSIIECLILLIVSGIAIMRYQKLTFPFKILAWSVIIVFILAIFANIFTIKYRNNAPILQVECIAEYVFYSLTYYYLFKNKLIKKTIIILIIIISLSFFINAVFVQPFNKVFPTNIYVPAQILLAVFSLLLFKEMLMYPVKINIIKQSVFWYNTAILFYSTTMFFNLGLSNYLAVHNLDDNFIFNFWYFITDVFHILICVAILTENKKINVTDE